MVECSVVWLQSGGRRDGLGRSVPGAGGRGWNRNGCEALGKSEPFEQSRRMRLRLLNGDHAPLKLAHAPLKLVDAPLELAHAPFKLTHAPLDLAHAPFKLTHAPVKLVDAPFDAIALIGNQEGEADRGGDDRPDDAAGGCEDGGVRRHGGVPCADAGNGLT